MTRLSFAVGKWDCLMLKFPRRPARSANAPPSSLKLGREGKTEYPETAVAEGMVRSRPDRHDGCGAASNIGDISGGGEIADGVQGLLESGIRVIAGLFSSWRHSAAPLSTSLRVSNAVGSF